ncbi:hypothetical protein [Micromonospora chalcea]|uniref:hypothetical protein n=1 Tax=Micromonospora chalcea TaxID=1874 RepID=UPI003D75749D
MKYARAAWWVFLAWSARKAHLPRRIIWELEDQATLRMFACTLDFKEVGVTAKPTTKE